MESHSEVVLDVLPAIDDSAVVDDLSLGRDGDSAQAQVSPRPCHFLQGVKCEFGNRLLVVPHFKLKTKLDCILVTGS